MQRAHNCVRCVSTLHAAIDSRCEELEARLSQAESTKIAALERELVTVDTALERWRSETRFVQDEIRYIQRRGACTLQQFELTARLDGLDAQLRSLPTAPVEPPHIGLITEGPAVLASIAGVGRVVAPLGISASDVSIEGLPRHVRPGQTLQLNLALGACYADQSAEELEVYAGCVGRWNSLRGYVM